MKLLLPPVLLMLRRRAPTPAPLAMEFAVEAAYGLVAKPGWKEPLCRYGDELLVRIIWGWGEGAEMAEGEEG